MRIWLDDNRDPTDPKIQIKYGAKGDEVWVKTTKEAKELLLTGQVESIAFDNDLGGNTIGSEGRTLARWIEYKAAKKEIERIEWSVHSENPIAKQEIRTAMTRAEKFWNER